MVIPLASSPIEPLIAEKTFVKVNPVSSPLIFTFDGKSITQEPGETINKPTFQITTKPPSSTLEPTGKSEKISDCPTICYKGQHDRTASGEMPDKDPAIYNQAIKSSLQEQ